MKHKIYTLLLLFVSVTILTACRNDKSNDQAAVSIKEETNKEERNDIEDSLDKSEGDTRTEDLKDETEEHIEEKDTNKKDTKKKDDVANEGEVTVVSDTENGTLSDKAPSDTVYENNSKEEHTTNSTPTPGTNSNDKDDNTTIETKPEFQKPSSTPSKPSTSTPTPTPEIEVEIPEITPEEDKEENSTSSDMSLTVRGTTINLGSSISSVDKQLGSADRILKGEYNFSYYIYNDDYSNLVFLFVKDKKVVGFYTDATSFDFMGIKPKASISDINKILGSSYSMSSVISHNKIDGYTLRILMDNIGSGKAVGIYLLPDDASFTGYTGEVLDNMDLMVLDITNSIRVRNQLSPLKWSNKAHVAALNHSIDMAENSYFSHTGLNGSTPGDRLSKAGVSWMTYGENIIGGYGNAILSTHAWFNSSGHRSNLLNANFTHLGVGFHYDKNSNYRNYCTQNFYK